MPLSNNINKLENKKFITFRTWELHSTPGVTLYGHKWRGRWRGREREKGKERGLHAGPGVLLLLSLKLGFQSFMGSLFISEFKNVRVKI